MTAVCIDNLRVTVCYKLRELVYVDNMYNIENYFYFQNQTKWNLKLTI